MAVLQFVNSSVPKLNVLLCIGSHSSSIGIDQRLSQQQYGHRREAIDTTVS